MENSTTDSTAQEPSQLVCQRCHSPLEIGDLRCAICGQSTPCEDSTEQHHVTVTVLRCKGCGAAMAYDAEHQAPSCSFCGEVVEVETIQDPMEQTEAYLPFTVTAKQAEDALHRWLQSRGWFRPSDLALRARITELKPLWWVAWVFDADAVVSWTADSNHGGRRSAWAPHAGQNRIAFDDILVSASRGLTEAESSAICGGMDLSTATDKPTGAAEGATIEQFDVQRSQARQYIRGMIYQIAAHRVRGGLIPGSKFRNVHVEVVLRGLVTRRRSLPAYVLAYRYKGTLYRVVICGQNAQFIIGNWPRSIAKMLLVAGAVVLVAIALLALIANA